jgi:hypothetical protein
MPKIKIHFNNEIQEFFRENLHQVTGVPYLPGLEFSDFRTMRQIGKKTRGAGMDVEHSWLSAFFKKELLKFELPSLSLRWIDEKMGWGVFAEQNFSTQVFIAEYSGVVRKRVKWDCKNAYCFEYPIGLGRAGSAKSSPYVIDAQDKGGISRYINHSDTPNLTSLSIHVEGIHHIILYTTKKIAKGEQLCYDYGPGYWQSRPKPKPL